jgi:hypothetical protein
LDGRISRGNVDLENLLKNRNELAGRRHREVEYSALLGPVQLTSGATRKVVANDRHAIAAISSVSDENLLIPYPDHLAGDEARTHDHHNNC